MSNDYKPTDQEIYDKINPILMDEDKIKEFCNYLNIEGKNKAESFCKTFDIPYPMSDKMSIKAYRWMKKDKVESWIKKSIKSLEVDWIDKRVNALQHLYNLGTDEDSLPKDRTAALDKFLTHLNREEHKIKLDMGNNTINIVQLVQDKLATITSGSTIMPNGYIDVKTTAEDERQNRLNRTMEAIIMKKEHKEDD